MIELGQLLAGPWAGAILGYLGADVVKVEDPAGDPIRTWRVLDPSGTSYWWRTLARNKRCVAIDLRQLEGQALAKRLILGADVLIENFRPGTMERWGLGPDVFERERPSLIYARVSGYGQSGPYRDRPGFAAVAEAVGGLRHLTGEPERPRVRTNLSLGDTLAGLHAAIGVLAALYERDAGGSGRGQVIDTALYEAVFSVLEGVVGEHAGAGIVRGPSGGTITGVVPSNAYPCRDGREVMIGANGLSLFQRLMRAVGRGDLAEDPELADNPGRVARAAELDAAIAAWTRARSVGEVVDALVEAAVPCGPVYDAADMAADPHFRARGLFEEVDGVVVPAIAPKLSRTPGRTRWAGRARGADTDAVLAERLGLDRAALDALRARKVI
ncbi:MAG: CoA transferase [Sandaracinaceae bacterium]|nr:CoA transferase [Sandaracinaceae bacterium]